MARCLRAFHWAEEPLNAEVPYVGDDVIVPDSDVDDSPYTKAKRNRRREAIGQRYLLGHIPFILTASLRGPFDTKSGWVAPWGKIKACGRNQRASTITRNHTEVNDTREAIRPKSEILGLESVAQAYVEDDTIRYDADNEDDTFEEMNDERTHLDSQREHLDDAHGKYAGNSHEKLYIRNIDENISNASNKNFQRLVKCNDIRSSRRAEKDFSANDRKRKVDIGWLKGANVLKRPRHRHLEHSSPSPVAGFIRDPETTLQLTEKSNEGHLIQGREITFPTREELSPDGLINGHARSVLDGNLDFHDTPSSSSENSFQFRKTNRKSWSQQESIPRCQQVEEEGVATKMKAGSPERDTEALEPTGAFHPRPTSSISISSSKLHGSDLDILNEPGRVSSPDPLSEDFRPHHEHKNPPELYQDSAENATKLSEAEVIAVDFQNEKIIQASITSLEHVISPREFASHGLFQPATSPAEPVVDKNGIILAQVCHFNDRSFPQPQSSRVQNKSTDLPHDSKELDVLPTPLAMSASWADSFKTPVMYPQIPVLSNATLIGSDAPTLEELALPTLSPWLAVDAEHQIPDVGSTSESHSFLDEEDSTVNDVHVGDPCINDAECTPLPSNVEGSFPCASADKHEEQSFKSSLSSSINISMFSNNSGQAPARFPSTQNLVEAATANPWNSTLKKTKRHNSDKRVSFGPLPLEEVDNVPSDAKSRRTERMGSPPPPACTLRLTQLDDPFHHRLKATQNLEVTEESLTRFMNTPWEDIPPAKSRAKPALSSPAIAAMAEAFIAADRQNLSKKSSDKEQSEPARFLPEVAVSTENITQFPVWRTSEQLDARGSSPFDASFSIAPSGKVTAVSIESISCNAEDDLHAVIEEMGSFLEGWDVESELKKAKGHTLEKRSYAKPTGKRECLSGLSNR